ncbi:MAG: bifunctional UDP-N-acetylmuramoyl-tripeptide:D-alanyl-D-alanine ligase/alanine racemase [Bacteroidales bacterium]|nr:bifunctional UDP-N-acetylmuramoyl-tripeptide:D-alanyl-D-alanine ligase/alanine racemase [Bacteroidales bacterium]
MVSYDIENISRILGGRTEGKTNITIRNILTDSRTVTVPEVTLFFALKGHNHNGHDFISGLYQRGVRAYVVSEGNELHDDYPDAGFIMVEDTLQSLQQLAAHHRETYTCPVTAITGSNGKTIIKEWLYHCLADILPVTRSPKSYNSQIGVPLSLWLLDDQTRLGIFEAGISLPGEMNRLRQMIKPDIGIFTNIGEAHQENFLNIEQKIEEKLKLFYGCRYLVFCLDHHNIRSCIERSPELAGVELFRWSFTSKADLQITGTIRKKGTTNIKGIYDHKSIDVTIPFTDSASIENAIHCLAFLLLQKIDPDAIMSHMSSLPPVAMRLEQKSGINGCTIINDSYNSDITSLSIALDVLERQLQHKRKTLILSDIFQSGKKQVELYKTVAGLSAEKSITRIIGIGDAICEYRQFFTIPGRFYHTTDEFLYQFNPDDFQDECVLIKGSRHFRFEGISALLELKKNTTRLEINLSALVHNLNHFRSLLNPGTKIMVMVKALSYGSGRHEIAGVLQHQRVDYLGVAFADEGIVLRKAGITLPVMVMNPEPESFDLIIQYKLEPEIYNIKSLLSFNDAVIRNQETDFPVHIKIDTGMHRLGFVESEISVLSDTLKKCRNIRIRSVFSHLAGSDEEIFDNFTQQQIRSFGQLSERISDALGYPVIRHILNTSGIARFPEAQYEMVRLGIGLYGFINVNSDKLRNVSTLKSTILQIKSVKKGDTVGYSRMGKPKKDSRIAVIPVGYADGLNRKLSNGKGKFLVNGKLAPVVGNICMDMTMIDVTNIPVEEGDEVIIFGDDIPLIQMADELGTIPYEILTGISERVKRVYFHE